MLLLKRYAQTFSMSGPVTTLYPFNLALAVMHLCYSIISILVMASGEGPNL